VIEVVLIVSLAVIFVIILNRVSQISIDPVDQNLALETYAVANSLKSKEISNFGNIDRLENHINKLLSQAEKAINTKKYSYAEKILLRVATLSPKESRSYAMLGNLYLKQQNYKDAIPALKETIKYNQKDAAVYLDLATAYYNLKNFGDAIKYFKKSIYIEPSIAHKYISLASAYELNHQKQKAIHVAKKAVDLEPENIAYQKILKELEK